MPAGDTGSIIAYSMRRDGFVYLESAGGSGVVGTRALYLRGGEVEFNVQSQGGYVRAQVCDTGRRTGENPSRYATSPLPGYTFDECEPFSGDDTAWTPRWKDGKSLADLAGQAVRLEVRLNSARLYAIRGDIIPISTRQHRAFTSDGVAPQRRIGFW